MAMQEIDAISDAIDATSKEIFSEAFDQEEAVLDESGDRLPEQMGEGLEGQYEADDDETESDEDEGSESDAEGEEKKGKGDTKDAKGEDDKSKLEADKAKPELEGRVPPGRLREQTEKTKAAEAERDAFKAQVETERANARKEIDELKAKFDGVLAALQRQPQRTEAKPAEAEKPTAPPDLFENPQGFVEHLTTGFKAELSTLQQTFARQRFEDSLAAAHERHGETFTKAYAAMEKLNPQNPDEFRTGQSIVSARNPGEAMVSWFKRNETLREVGDDPAKFKERIATETREALMKDPEFRKQLLADLRSEAATGDDGKPRTQTRLPKSLNGATGGRSSHAGEDLSSLDDSDRAVFDSAWR